MPKIIIKVPNIKGKSASAGLINYIAKREGVDKSVNQKVHVGKPSKNQMKYIEEILNLCPDAKDTYEYQDYIENPTIKNASAFISVATESNPQIFESRETYLSYISTRPNVEKTGKHGLFGNEYVVDISKVKDEIGNQKAVIWTPIISLRREDAARLGYDNASAWRDLIRANQVKIAEIFNIPQENFRWYAAFHNEGHHPHIHMVVYAKDSNRGHLSEQGIEKFKSIIANDVFKNEMYEIFSEKSKQRDKISEESKKRLKELADKIREKDYSDSPVCDMLINLSRKLIDVKGKKTYGYLPKSLKREVDNIVKAMAEDSDIQNLYAEWCALQKKIVEIYNDKEVEFPKLWENDNFKNIRNAVIKEAVKLCDDRIIIATEEAENAEESPEEKSGETHEQTQETSQPREIYPGVAASALNLFCRLASIIDNDAEKQIDGHNKTIVDSKERKELAIKKQRLGIKMG